MAKQTVYGTIMIKSGKVYDDVHPMATFRLHAGKDVSDAEMWYFSLPREFCLFSRGPLRKQEVVIKLQREPTLLTIYNREIYVGKGRDADGNIILQIKEGPRFMATPPSERFAAALGLFLSENIPEIKNFLE